MEKIKDLPQGRFTKGRSFAGDTTFTILRALDVPFQWALLHYFAAPEPVGSQTILGLSTYHSVIVGLVFVSVARQIYWKLYIADQIFATPFAVGISAFNTINNGLNVGMALWPAMSTAPAPGESLLASPTRVLGLMLFIIGSYAETVPELGRKSFKADPRNKGKIYKGGLFGMARHVNFAGYSLWRSGFALFTGGLIWGAAAAEMFFLYFTKVGIPTLAEYMQERYGAQWTEYKKKVPYELFPGIV